MVGTSKGIGDINISVQFLNFWMPENFAVIYLKFIHRGKPIDISA